MPADRFDPLPRPFFSVVIPTRDRPDTLVQAVTSVLAQDFRDFELLVVDNAGTPPARQVLADVANPHLRIVTAPQRLAMHRNWELGLAAARGPLPDLHRR